jgi:hypothetical protein
MFRLISRFSEIGVIKDIFYVKVKMNFYFVLPSSFSKFVEAVMLFVRTGSVKATLC